ncbi:MAG: sigma-70 family RNA polymerase sigma factor [Paenibacillaceae bacterium]
MNQVRQSTCEHQLLDSARSGDASAYQQLVEPYRRELLAHCYRMLGSGEDAEDALQDTLLRAWRGLPGFEGRSAIRTWLYKITTNICLNLLAKRPKRLLAVDYGPVAIPENSLSIPLPESVWIEPYSDELLGLKDDWASPEVRYEQRESVELAFIAAFQLLPPYQRATLILRQVLGFSAQEVADSLGTTVASINSALQRARITLEQRRPKLSQQAALLTLGDNQLQTIVKNYMDAMESADIEAILVMLTEDATWSMPPRPSWFCGREAISRFLSIHVFSVRWRHLPTRANGQLAVGCYMWNPQTNTYTAACLDVLTLRGARIAAVTGFMNDKFFRLFNLPEEL